MENGLEAEEVEAPDHQEAAAVVPATMNFTLMSEHTQRLPSPEGPSCFYAQGRAFNRKLS